MQSSRGHLMVSCKSPALTPKKTAAAAAGSGLQQNGAPRGLKARIRRVPKPCWQSVSSPYWGLGFRVPMQTLWTLCRVVSQPFHNIPAGPASSARPGS